MKKFFTLVVALLGFAGAASAETVDDIKVTKHSYALVCDELGSRPGKGKLFGDDHFLDVTGGSISTSKGSIDLSVADGVLVTEEIAAKYGELGSHYNFLRLKKKQDVIAMKVTAQSKVIIFYQDNNKDDRYPVFAKDADLTDKYADGVRSERCSGEEGAPAANLRRIEWTASDDGLVYIGDNNGDMFCSFILIEANEAPGTPSVKVGPQAFEGGLWYREVTCKATEASGFATVVTYTTDGSEPTAASTLYTAPIKCYSDATIRFQAYMDLGTGTADEAAKMPNADNEANVNFSFDAPAISADGATFTITTPYAEQNGTNFYSINGADAVEGNGATLTESATVEAFTKIKNGDYATFESKKSTADVYVLNPIKAKKTITVSGNAAVDEEATAANADGQTVYKAENAANTADKADFFIKTLVYGVLANADAAKAKYQVPAGQEVYIQMSNTNITFYVAEGDSVNVKVVCSKNSCKNIDEAEEDVKAEGSKVADNRKCFVNVDGTNYGGEDLVDNPDGNVIEFGLTGGYHTFKKYSGTGNILISSIEITPASAEPAEEIEDITSRFTYTWNQSETLTNNEDGSITFNAVAWGGMAAWLKDGDVAADWSGYSKVVFEFAEPTTVNTQILVGGTDAKAWGEIGITTLECPFEGINMTTVEQIALQASDVTTITVKRVYLVKASTGIETVKVLDNQNGVIYNLSGQKVDASYRGVVIKNGKKFFQK